MSRPAPLTLEMCARFYDLPVQQAAAQLGVSRPTISKVLRANGIKRWPYRKLKAQGMTADIKQRRQQQQAQLNLPVLPPLSGLAQLSQNGTSVPRGRTQMDDTGFLAPQVAATSESNFVVKEEALCVVVAQQLPQVLLPLLSPRPCTPPGQVFGTRLTPVFTPPQLQPQALQLQLQLQLQPSTTCSPLHRTAPPSQDDETYILRLSDTPPGGVYQIEEQFPAAGLHSGWLCDELLDSGETVVDMSSVASTGDAGEVSRAVVGSANWSRGVFTQVEGRSCFEFVRLDVGFGGQ